MFFVDQITTINLIKQSKLSPFPNELWRIIEEALLEMYVPKRPPLLKTIQETIVKKYHPYSAEAIQPTMVVTVHGPGYPTAVQRCILCGHVFIAIIGRGIGLRCIDLSEYDCECENVRM